MEDFKIRKAAVALVRREATDGKILVVWNRRYRGWTLPGGLVEDGEEPEMALHRELMEETGTYVAQAGLPGRPADRENPCLLFSGPHGMKVTEGRAAWVYLYRVDLACPPWPREVEEGSPVTWMTRGELLHSTPFREFYERVVPAVPAWDHGDDPWP